MTRRPTAPPGSGSGPCSWSAPLGCRLWPVEVVASSATTTSVAQDAVLTTTTVTAPPTSEASAAAVRVGDDDPDVIDTATRAVALARQSGAPHAISTTLITVAGALAGVDSDRARSLLTEGIQMDTGYEDANPLTHQAILAAPSATGDSRWSWRAAPSRWPIGPGHLLPPWPLRRLRDGVREATSRGGGPAPGRGPHHRALARCRPTRILPVPATASSAVLGDEQVAERRREDEDIDSTKPSPTPLPRSKARWPTPPSVRPDRLAAAGSFRRP